VLCRDLGLSAMTTNLSVLVVAFGTMVAVYARSPWSEICQAAIFTGFFVWLLRLIRQPTARAAVWVGVWGGATRQYQANQCSGIPRRSAAAGLLITRHREEQESATEPRLRAGGLAAKTLMIPAGSSAIMPPRGGGVGGGGPEAS
jgi:hypothetical protein